MVAVGAACKIPDKQPSTQITKKSSLHLYTLYSHDYTVLNHQVLACICCLDDQVFRCHQSVSGFDKHYNQGYAVKETNPGFSINVSHILRDAVGLMAYFGCPMKCVAICSEKKEIYLSLNSRDGNTLSNLFLFPYLLSNIIIP